MSLIVVMLCVLYFWVACEFGLIVWWDGILEDWRFSNKEGN